jgi:alkanesulfonate monooxygenase SsuD/methylene tetrahydromethanopterin reductase-like flavin-dependent oxidoreductase (luciferase family)
VVRAWTQPGPWRYEGKHFHYRFVDPWALPLQKPHPPIWIPGLLSPETVIWCAQHRYPYVALATFLEPTVELWNIYRDAAAKEGYQVGPENFGYLQKIFVAETEEKARDLAKYDMFGGAGIGYSLFGQPQWMFPPGYNSKEATRRIARQFSDPANQDQAFGGAFAPPTQNDNIAASQVEVRTGAWQPGESRVDTAALRKQIFDAFPKVEQSMQVICGTPKSVIPKIRKVLEVLRPGIFGVWQNDGPISAEARTTSMKMIAKEVLPAVREIAKELDLVSPFERTPGQRKLPATGVPESVGSMAPLAS